MRKSTDYFSYLTLSNSDLNVVAKEIANNLLICLS